MDYSIQKSLHERSLSILLLREKAIKRLAEKEEDFYRFERMGKVQRMQVYYNLRDYQWFVAKCKRSVSFLEGMYERHMWKMRDTIPCKSAMLLPGAGFMLRNDVIPEIDYWQPRKGYVTDHRFTLPDIEPDYSPIVLKSDRVAGLVEPVGVTYEERYSPDSIDFQ